jgi:predicted SAM-dependent methyltransferase/glycosyltransferase involved in cell wall biosynthesis
VPKLSIISHFYNNCDKVVGQVEHWSRIDSRILREIEFILVDDCSDDLPDIKTYSLNIRLFRIDSDIPWNQAGARNLGALNARGEWGLFFDIDQVLDVGIIGTLLQALDNLDSQTMHYMKLQEALFNSIDNVTSDFHLNSFLVYLNTFRAIGMYDEDFAGHYGYEDVFLPRFWDHNGGKRILLADPCFFEKQQDFATSGLDRDLDHNRTVLTRKIAALNQILSDDTPESRQFLRFRWHEVELNDGHAESLPEKTGIAAVSEELKRFIVSHNLPRFHLGCGANFLRGWLNINYWPHLEQGRLYANPNQTEGTFLLNHDLQFGIPAANDSLDAIYHTHLLEHLTYIEGLEFLQRCHGALKIGGVHRVVVRDLEAFSRAYLSEDDFLLEKYKTHVLKDRPEIYQTSASIFMGMLHNHGHKCGYDWQTLEWALKRSGFKHIRRTLFQESDLPDITEIEIYSPLRALESICVECSK